MGKIENLTNVFSSFSRRVCLCGIVAAAVLEGDGGCENRDSVVFAVAESFARDGQARLGNCKNYPHH